MIDPLQTLIIEDQPIVLDGYIRVLETIASRYDALNFKIRIAESYDEAIMDIEHAIDYNIINLVLLDINLPPSKNGKLVSGDDLAIKLRFHFPGVKIIVLTQLNDNYRLVNILKNVKPDGLLVKSELKPEDFVEAVLDVLNDIPFYSDSVLKVIRRHLSNDLNLDDIDRQMLYHLSLGAKTKDLTEIVNLSQAGIEKRKRKLIEVFNLDEKSDKLLLKLAKEKGFL
ncbi:DNA-binding response regulator [Seonamhaeicola sp.]|uniref:DNA-binding response regulator n=1 Tax=Seonamhaeicola sp. TaxID=1912245 RepID=UPI00261BFF38|nr:DNA-binding response regulator [Seonamhaeicola sp.]